VPGSRDAGQLPTKSDWLLTPHQRAAERAGLTASAVAVGSLDAMPKAGGMLRDEVGGFDQEVS
jgi:hypothetical protein